MNKCKRKRVEKMTNFGVLFYPETRTCKIWDVERNMTLTEVLDDIYRLIEQSGGGGGSAIWGEITGDITNLTDLMLLFLDLRDYVDNLVIEPYNNELLKYIWDVLVEIEDLNPDTHLDPDDSDTWPTQSEYIEKINENVFFDEELESPRSSFLVRLDDFPRKYEEIEFILNTPRSDFIGRTFVAFNEESTEIPSQLEYYLRAWNSNQTYDYAGDDYYRIESRTFDIIATDMEPGPVSLNSRVRITNMEGIKPEFLSKTSVRYVNDSYGLSLAFNDCRGFFTEYIANDPTVEDDSGQLATVSFNSTSPFPAGTRLIGYRILRRYGSSTGSII